MQNEEPRNRSDIDLKDFHKIGKGKNGEPGNPYEILDGKIADYITQEQLTMFVLNGKPYLYQNGYYQMDEDGKILKAHIKALICEELITITRINRVYNLILADYRLTKKYDQINQHPIYWINFQNGMYDVIQEQMWPHSPKYCSINQIPHEFDGAADYKNTVAEKFILGLIPDELDRQMYLTWVGYCMTIDTRLQKFFTILGVPGSGKSTGLNLLTDAIGKDNISCITLQSLGDRFSSSALMGKLVNACSDLPKTALEQTDMIKRMTGEDEVNAEYKGGAHFSFRSYAKLNFTANEMPVSLDEKSGAFYRRVLAFWVAERGAWIDNLKEGLQYSMPGFIRECVRQLHGLYVTGRKIESPNCKELVRQLQRESDSVTAFLDECTEKKSGGRVERGELYRAYEAFCMVDEWPPINSRSFYKNLRGKGFRDYCAADGKRYFKDIMRTVINNTARAVTATADFQPASEDENAVFQRG